MREARYYRTEDDAVRCLLCPHACLLADGKTGLCSGRQNLGGKLQAVNYGQTVSLAVDPIEKKPLYHFYPGSSILSIAPNGCNLRCPFCQNWQISQGRCPTQYISPERLADLARDYESAGVAYTYSEPLIWFEYLLDAGALIHSRGLKNVLVTNGLINPEPLEDVIPVVDAANIDIKGMDQDFYDEVKGDFQTVKRTIERVKDCWHMELTNLIIPTKNDSDEAIMRLVDFVAGLNEEIPLHFSRYFPSHRYDIPPTPEATLRRAYSLAKRKLKHVYLGNIRIEGTQDTECPDCGQLLVRRSQGRSEILGLSGGVCTHCGRKANIVV